MSATANSATQSQHNLKSNRFSELNALLFMPSTCKIISTALDRSQPHTKAWMEKRNISLATVRKKGTWTLDHLNQNSAPFLPLLNDHHENFTSPFVS